MPNESLNVYLTATDKMSPVLATITDKTKALDKGSQELQQTFEALQKANKGLIERKTELQKKLQEVNEEVKEARKSFKALGDEASSDAYEKAQQKQQKLRNEITATTKSLQENQKIYKENIETIRKGGTEGQGTGLSDIAKGLFAGQVGQMLSSSLGGLGQSVLTSAIGTPEASLISDTLSSAISGVAAGSILGVPGMVAGGLLGAASGAISGGTKIFEAKDDAFKEYYGGLYQDVSGQTGETVEGGSAVAGGREQTRMAFAQRLGGDQEARDYLSQVEQMAAQTNYEYDEIVGYAKLLLNSYDPDEVFGVLRDLSDATAGLNLSSSDVNMMISGLSRMRTTGKATQEYLNYFRERGVDTDQALADSLGVQKSSVADIVKDGGINGADAAEAILSYIQETFGGLSDTLASTYDAMVDNLGDMTASLQAAGGDAYNELRKEGVSEQMAAYEGELGDAIKEINAIMGENQARQENLQDQYMREVLDAVLNGGRGELWSTFDKDQQNTLAEMSRQYAEMMDRYEGGDTDAGAELESLYEQAQALGQAYYDNSDEVKRLNDIELDEVEAIRQNTAGLDDATQASYRLSQELSKGLAVKVTSAFGYSSRGEYVTRGREENGLSRGHITERRDLQSNRHAYGLERVPYDGYPALLHEGERVLTASEARAQDNAAPVQLNDIELDGVKAIRQNTPGLSDAINRLSWEPTEERGIRSASSLGQSSREEYITWGQEENSLSQRRITERQSQQGSRRAFGLERAPYDGYPALFRAGEQVLAGNEARAQDSAAPIQLTVTGNNFVGTPEEMADQLWSIIVRKLEREQTAAAPK